ncbi:uncharacterized protein EI97DRAFT_192399 [Westerdykella ornata]|uniref:Uncharacterized protein n=1 Tax=Westerdykella ornata TaxID=318751 RepID=A0A6A6J9V3_WESOR|nr:uncharacterized protein EI97DRAFT_192399 [Westerdykella ornata]KAF2273004.1 hypothetical protein EI97DRAFT_192399 [Westerdykella ornata]
MAEQIAHDVVKEAQSMGGPSPIDDTATSTNTPAGDGKAPSETPNAQPRYTDTETEKESRTEGAAGTATDTSDKAGPDAPDVSQSPPLARHIDKVQNHAKGSDKGQDAAVTTTDKKEALVNGDSGEQSAPEDFSAPQTAGEVSGASDTDISRPGSVDQTKRDAGHLRTSSLKKPPSFKSVSVTKNFLAKSAVSTPTARPGDKASGVGQTSTATQPTAKPRLVAKSGSGIGNISRSSLSKANGLGTGPDASKVWNKNQPVAPPPPKQFTDEELKQQYGIHLATRLQADESSKEAKWADIDEDEDDWAPDTVQWADGTRSSVAAAAVESIPPPAEDVKSASKKEEAAANIPKPVPSTISGSQRPSATSGTKTILKPGAHAQATAAKSSLVLKGQPEKPTLVAKPSSATPVKSPWAALPPVDKVPPVQINPPVQQPVPPRYSQRETQGYETTHPHFPTREMAPDDFNRSWRDDRGSRELFNSQSGRYEPVSEMRRGSVRDSGLRHQPSLLQRPPQEGPAEPSAAFQTSRTSSDAPAWGRRRTSSNVSGGSGRMFMDRRGPEHPGMALNMQRRDSHAVNGTEAVSPGLPRPELAHKGPLSEAQHTLTDQHGAWQQRASPRMANVQPLSPYGSVGSAGTHEGTVPTQVVPTETAVEVQNRLMREKLERARLAKQKEREKEEQEEAARKERLRKKLEAMGLADDVKPKSKDTSPSRSAERSPQKAKATPAVAQSPPKPPVPKSEGEVAQYGMMKVHQPQPVKKQMHTGEGGVARPTRGAEEVPKPSASPVKGRTSPSVAAQPPSSPSPPAGKPQPPSSLTSDNSKNKDNNGPAADKSRPRPQENAPLNTSQPLKPSQPTPSVWSSTLPQQPRSWASNVWGPPQPKDRALGNGNFDLSYNRGQSRPSPPQLPPQSQQPGQAPSLGLPPPIKPSQPQQTTPNPPFAQPTMATQVETMNAPKLVAGPKQPGPIAPPVANGWGNFAAAIRRDDIATMEKNLQEFERMGGKSFRPEIHETYTDQKGQSQSTVHTKAGGPATATNAGKPEATQPVRAEGIAAVANEAPAQTVANNTAARSSRFFPRASEATTQPAPQASSSGSPPPPPPEIETHPVYETGSARPVVRFPKPTPTGPVSMPSRPSGVRLGMGARPLALNPEWQARFNRLWAEPQAAPSAAPTTVHSVPVQPAGVSKPGALAVAASSKAPLEVREVQAPATVSLPSAVAKKTSDESLKDVTTRSSADNMMLEEREFGSLPVVKLPHMAHRAAGEAPVSSPTHRPNFRNPRAPEVTTKPMYNGVEQDRNADTINVIILLPGMSSSITKTMPKKREQRRNAGPRGPKRTNYNSNNAGSSSGNGPRPRKPSSYQGQGSNTSNSTRPSGGNGWNGTRSGQTWARRTDAVH